MIRNLIIALCEELLELYEVHRGICVLQLWMLFCRVVAVGSKFHKGGGPWCMELQAHADAATRVVIHFLGKLLDSSH